SAAPQRTSFRPEAKEYSRRHMACTMALMTATTPAAVRPEPPPGRTTYRSVFAAGEFRALFTALADRLPSRLVIGTGLLTRAAPGLVIGLWPALPVPVMLALVAAAAAIAPVFTAAISGLLPEVLDGDR